jgi:hypothetical protein
MWALQPDLAAARVRECRKNSLQFDNDEIYPAALVTFFCLFW